MIEMVRNAVSLFFQGKLFRDNKAFFRQWGIGFAAALALMFVLGVLNPWLGAIVGSLAGGAAMPWLFKDLKYN
jgi:hypothetical protein